ncbi:hypothetical protein [Pseudoalteromonas sp. APC 3691]|uniref:hypothetical protein n=1 Tax=Pseudoalteromonas sp. APC 3691 TaxID=3035173 RepID=UPI0025B5E321|nr:hypothetical protein [Pseudoalteromonas sp. APC 3691]MDN3389543.1 hypothetical protein [Pseudoalteromonas sp. APC 3691]
MKKITCVLFATHHNSKNIASIRYISLIKYIDPHKFEFIIVTKAVDNDTTITKNENITVIPIVGGLLGQSNMFMNLKNLVYLMLGFGIKRNIKSNSFFKGCWASNAMASLERYLESQLNSNKNIVAMGSYSPIDALIASSNFSSKYNIPLIQDFRDGFLFESLGRKSKFLNVMRKKLETIACENSSLIMTVSNPLVDDFKLRYPNNKVTLMHNGFDPDDFTGELKLDESDQLVSRVFFTNKKVIGHFGRISASDASRWESLKTFLKTFSTLDCGMKSEYTLLFVGELENREVDLIKATDVDFIISQPVERGKAITYMSKCDYLLLLTGDSKGCATGKIFEYINAKKKIMCFTGVENEATKILKETSTGKGFVNQEIELEASFKEYILNSETLEPKKAELEKYNKINQAQFFESLIKSLII